jgi:serine/threonine protein phosphatase PrpC
LSEDHKPELPVEYKRICEAGGRIDSFHDSLNNEPLGPQRVWLRDQEMPGLAMSRSMGDTVAHSVGVSSHPEVKHYTLGVQDKFIVIGSDGVFEFLTNEDVAKIVLPYFQINQPEQAANEIVKAAFKKWREEEEVVDDITAVVIFLEPLMAYGQLEDKKEPKSSEVASVKSSQFVRKHHAKKSNSIKEMVAEYKNSMKELK